MKYAIWNKTEKPIGIVQIIYDQNFEPMRYDDFAQILNRHRFLVYGCDMKSACDLARETYELPVFLIGVGRGGEFVQEICHKKQNFAGAISILARTPMLKRFGRVFPLKFGVAHGPKIPLMIVGGWSAVRQMQAHVSVGRDAKNENLSLLVYPEISVRNAFGLIEKDVINFLNDVCVRATI